MNLSLYLAKSGSLQVVVVLMELFEMAETVSKKYEAVIDLDILTFRDKFFCRHAQLSKIWEDS